MSLKTRNDLDTIVNYKMTSYPAAMRESMEKELNAIGPNRVPVSLRLDELHSEYAEITVIVVPNGNTGIRLDGFRINQDGTVSNQLTALIDMTEALELVSGSELLPPLDKLFVYKAVLECCLMRSPSQQAIEIEEQFHGFVVKLNETIDRLTKGLDKRSRQKDKAYEAGDVERFMKIIELKKAIFIRCKIETKELEKELLQLIAT